MNTKLRAVAKNDLEKDFFKVNEYLNFWKNYRKCKKHRNIKLITTDRKKKYIQFQNLIIIQQNVFQKINQQQKRKNQKIKNEKVNMKMKSKNE